MFYESKGETRKGVNRASEEGGRTKGDNREIAQSLPELIQAPSVVENGD